MQKLAKERRINIPKMVVDLPLKKEFKLQPNYLDNFIQSQRKSRKVLLRDVPLFFDRVPKVYMGKRSKYTVGILKR